ARPRATRAVARIYSAAAGRLYEPLVVRRAFPLFGGDLNAHVAEHGRRAVAAAAGGGPILDMPVGTACFTTAVAAAHPGLVAGVDIAPGMVRAAAAAASRAGTPNLAVVCADAHALPFADGAFGAVVCSNGLQVIPGARGAVAELARVLAPGGKLFVTVVGVPVGAALPRGAAARLPVVMRGRRDVVALLDDAGLRVTSSARDRLALVVEAVKPPLR
ncbi:MAG TPA: class I SAM-dependent methyltransferase, partial [Actinomycetota bacterium]|nr:class I SAM-dependent methyltransferase [Actinomycetota bacterium]